VALQFNWTHGTPVILAAFLASLVEFVEALTIVLAVGVTQGWRIALSGAATGVVALGALLAAFGPALRFIDVRTLQLLIGILLLLFGMRWLRKAILRAGGVLRLHDEVAIFATETRTLGAGSVGFITSCKAVVIEGIEVVFVVLAVGSAGNMLLPAMLGALAAGLLVVFLGILLHRPLARVPENTLKFAVGVLLSAFGVFWIGEGSHFHWIGGDWAILALIAGFLLVSILAIPRARQA